MKERRILYYLPMISTEEVIELSDLKIKPFSEDASYSDLLPKDIFNHRGSLIEVDNFVSGDFFSASIDEKIYNAIERIKFGYFFLNPPFSSNIFGYISSETFECFRIFEKNTDSSFEHKVNLSNGMFNFSESLEIYYKSRISLNQKSILIKSNNLAYVDYLSENVTEQKFLTAMKLYNRCWSTYSLHNSIDKPVLAKVSIEVLAKLKYGKKDGLKKFIDDFLSCSHQKLEELSNSSPTIKQLIKLNLFDPENFKDIISNHIKDISKARNDYAHNGVENVEFINMPFYLVWFPLFWMVIFRLEKMTEAEGIRLALFFCLLKFQPQDWQKIEFSELPTETKKNHLHMYSDSSRSLPIYLKREQDSKEISDAMLNGISKWLNPKLN